MILLSLLQNWIPCHIFKVPLLGTSVCNNADILSVRIVLTFEVQERITLEIQKLDLGRAVKLLRRKLLSSASSKCHFNQASFFVCSKQWNYQLVLSP